MIELITTVALVILFLHVTTWEAQIFGPFAKKYLSRLPEWIKKPLYDCPICMAPWWGSLILATGNWVGITEAHNWFGWILIVFGAGGLNTLLIYLINQGKSVTKTLDKDFDCGCVKKQTTEEKAAERRERIEKKVSLTPVDSVNEADDLESFEHGYTGKF